MRLHRLSVVAFGPFSQRQDVDFDAVTAGGLFLLEGPTGAGKTAVLDAITFALYGGLSGGSSGSDRLHSHHSDPGVEPNVELEFSSRGRRHRIRRSPEWERPRRRGDGMTTQRAGVHLERWSGTGWRSLSSNKAEVGEFVGDLLGLTREQFNQVVLLPQGEFAAFLRAGDDDRRRLLTKLFDALLYDEITDELNRRRTAALASNDATAARGRDRLSATGEAGGLDVAAREALLGAAEDDRLETIRRLADALDQASLMAEQRAERARADHARAVVRHEAAVTVWRRGLRHRAALRAWRDHQDGAAQAAEDGSAVDWARRAAPVAPLITILDRAAADLRAQQDRVVAGWAGVADGPGSVASGEIGDVTDENFVADVLSRLRDLAADHRQAAADLRTSVDVEADLGALRDACTAAQLAADGAAKLVARLDDRRDELPALVAAARTALAAARDAAAALPGAGARAHRLRERIIAARSLVALEPEIAGLSAERERAVEAHQRAVDAHQHAVAARLAGLAAELAGRLRDGEPCGVCGSTDHPAPAPSTDTQDRADGLKRAERARHAAEAARQEVEARCSRLAEQRAALEASAGPRPLAELVAAGSCADADVAGLEQVAATRAEAEDGLTEREVEQGRWQTDRERAGTELALAHRRSAEAIERLAQAERLVASGCDGYSSVAEHRAARLAAAEAALGQAESITALIRAAAAHRTAQVAADQAGTTAGFANVDAVRQAIRCEADLSVLEGRLAQWQRDEARLLAAIDAAGHIDPDSPNATEQVSPETSVDELPTDLDAIEAYVRSHEAVARQAGEAAQRSDAAAQSARSQRDAARAAVERFGARVQEWRAAEDEAAQTAAAGAAVIALAELARGMAGSRRTTLTTFVLRHWFERVVAAANTRLGAMSSGRYELLRTDVGSRAGERSGLGLRILDQHTGVQRSTTSMSGGETFYTSLALALGLADVVSAEASGAQLDTLFIDEGFGSLDADTLDQVMGVIDDLRENGRVVGIVSHVGELKERIPERIEVRRAAGGASTLTVRA